MISPKAKLFILLHTHRLKTNQGFTMVEVVVGILLVLIFTMIAMQAMVMATAIRVRSQEVTEASRWIQKDLENLGTTANRLNYDSVNETYPSSSTLADHAARCIATTSSAGYAQLLQSSSSVGADTDLEKLSEIGTGGTP
ncbi:MAG: type II secretion system protein [Acaryochloridaceae cyanobacterium RU_4_10]|nr:type II secretion system protein [Acaryochloridaceae cyanobacterium RU_4_10]